MSGPDRSDDNENFSQNLQTRVRSPGDGKKLNETDPCLYQIQKIFILVFTVFRNVRFLALNAS